MNTRPLGLLAAVALGLAVPTMAVSIAPEVASAHHVILKRESLNIDGVELRTRGYLHEQCVLGWSPCLSRSTRTFKPEATAQAKVIQELAVRHPDPSGLLDKVQWEVAPGPDSEFAPYADDTDENMDPDWGDTECSDYRDEEGRDQTSCRVRTRTKWRIDVLVNDGPPTALEIKAWNPAAVDDARRQLADYVRLAGERGLTIEQSTELNRPQAPTSDLPDGRPAWSTSYLDSGLNTWCVWADPIPGNEGLVYFAPKAGTPPEVRLRTPGCGDADDREKVYDELDKRIALIAISGGLANELSNLPPNAFPRRRDVPEEQLFVPQEWVTDAPREPQHQQVLTISFGDGTSASSTVPAGSGLSRTTFSHTFAWSGGDVYQQNVAFEGGPSGDATVTRTRPPPQYEPPPEHVCD